MLCRRQVSSGAEEIVLVEVVEILHVEEVGKVVDLRHRASVGFRDVKRVLREQRCVAIEIVGSFTKAERSVVGVRGCLEVAAQDVVFRVD